MPEKEQRQRFSSTEGILRRRANKGNARLRGWSDNESLADCEESRDPQAHRLWPPTKQAGGERRVQEYRSANLPPRRRAGVSIEVFADLDTKAEQMLAQGKDMFSWIPNAYIKYPCTHEGLRAAQMSVRDGIRVNITLCFSQDQAAAVYGATMGTASPAYVSPFVGRLDDRGENGMDLIQNIRKMYDSGDGHVHILAASIRNLDHLMASFAFGADLVTVPAKVLEEWAAKGFPLPGQDFTYKGKTSDGRSLKPIPYKSLELNKPWENFDIAHELTTKGIRKFVEDYQSTLKKIA